MSSKTQRYYIYALAPLRSGFLGNPMDHVYEDRELFADFLTTYYIDHEPESCFLFEVDGEICRYLLESRKPLQNQRLAVFRSAGPLFSVQRMFASLHSLDAHVWLARSARSAGTRINSLYYVVSGILYQHIGF